MHKVIDILTPRQRLYRYCIYFGIACAITGGVLIYLGEPNAGAEYTKYHDNLQGIGSAIIIVPILAATIIGGLWYAFRFVKFISGVALKLRHKSTYEEIRRWQQEKVFFIKENRSGIILNGITYATFIGMAIAVKIILHNGGGLLEVCLFLGALIAGIWGLGKTILYRGYILSGLIALAGLYLLVKLVKFFWYM